MLYIEEPYIEVGVLADTKITFELKGSFVCQSINIDPGVYSVVIDSGRLKTMSFESETDIVFTPQDTTASFILKDVAVGIDFHWEHREDQEFVGSLKFQIEGEKVRAVNLVLLEDYLKSVISSEMSAMNDSVLLATHAIVSRSWLLAQISGKIKHKASIDIKNIEGEVIRWYDRDDHETFDVCADDHCQRYQGITKVISHNVVEAIEKTRGQVLTYDGEICDARFSKCCGGITEDFSNVWQPNRVPYLVSVRDSVSQKDISTESLSDESFILSSPDAFCNTQDSDVLSQIFVDFDRRTTNFFRWSVKYDQEELSSLIARKSGVNFGNILDLRPVERGKSGRITRLEILGDKRTLVVGKELEIRKWLSQTHLYSSAFVVERLIGKGETIPFGFVLHGAGWGHGVGLCQVGAAMMSKQGYSTNQILEHYFKGVTVQKIY